jgi:hypothetical protein
MDTNAPELTERSNHQVEATAPSRCSFDRDKFYYVIVPGGAPLPGAVPQLSRWALLHART